MSEAAPDLVPYVMGRGAVIAPMLGRCPLPDPVAFDVLDPSALDFYRLVNAANNHAFGGLGMPAWVQLDCCTLPTAMIGLAARREDIEVELWRALVAQAGRQFGEAAGRGLDDYAGLVPVSEYCAARSFEPDTVVGFSLFALLPGRGLAVRTKAMALRCYGASRQIGATQYGNASVRTHCAFGPLRVVAARAVAHSQPGDTFIYALELDDLDRLDALACGAPTHDPPIAPTHWLPLEVGGVGAGVERLVEAHGEVWIAPPGQVEVAGERRLVLICKGR